MNFFPAPDIRAIYALLAAVSPLAAFGIIMIAVRGRHRLSAVISISAAVTAFICALLLFAGHWQTPVITQAAINWAVSDALSIPLGMLLDGTSILMLLVVTLICLLVQIYSLGYMAGDPGFGRYYGYMSLFAWAMISLTIAPNLLQLYVFWELVGLSSYLLIGFWNEKFSAGEAGKKAFVMTRTGDVAFFLGLLLVLGHLGNLDILTVNRTDVGGAISSGTLTLAVLLIFGGIVGKSAQFPLLTWLPDAMEGPTPVSALLHSATMVAAGVYLFVRLFPFFSLSPTAMSVCLFIGTLSMLMASTMAMVSRDIKQVWAYSTISQLGFMIMALSAGNLFAGMFHLTTHAGFKALLFLCSGVLIHHFDTNDIETIGKKGGRRVTIAMSCMILAAAALSGLPPLSGFFSKEAIIAALAALDNPIWLAAGLIGAFLTSYYSFRLIFLILFPREIDGHDASPHPPTADDHLMAGPLLVLAAVTLALGFCRGWLEDFLGPPLLHESNAHAGAHPHFLPYIAIALVLAGILLAYFEFGRRGAPRAGFVEKSPKTAQLFAQRWYLDQFYRFLLDHIVYRVISAACDRNDRHVIDGGLDGLAFGAVSFGRLLARLQSGLLQHRLMAILTVMVLTALYILF